MKVKELIQLLSQFDEDALVVTSSSKNTWGGYVEVQNLKEEILFRNGVILENERDADESEDRNKIHTIILEELK
jgi:hypothetical protein